MNIFEQVSHVLSLDSILCLDVESTGLNVRRDKVIGIGFSNENGETVYIPLLIWDGTKLCDTPYKDLARQTLTTIRDEGRRVICHNAAYDLRIINHNLGIQLLPNLHMDTILLKHTLDENPPFGLKDLAVKYAAELGYDRDPTEEQATLKREIIAAGGSCTKESYELYKAPTNIIARYCEQDCKLTMDLYLFLMRKLAQFPKLQALLKEEVLPLYKLVSIPMMERGIKLDLDKIMMAHREINLDIHNLEKEVQEKLAPHSTAFKQWFFENEYPPRNSGKFATTLAEVMNLPLPRTKMGKCSIAKDAVLKLPPSISKDFLLYSTTLPPEIVECIQWKMHGDEGGPYFVNINSKDHLRKIIFNYLNEKPARYTDKGAWQLDDDFLQTIAHKYDFIPPLLIYNKLNKIRATYIERFLNEQEDSIFYPSFNQHRTISGRFGSDIQQLPRKRDDGEALTMKYTNMIRGFFISRDHYSFIDADYESLEPHIFAHVSGDQGLISIFNNGEDFYSKIAIMTEKLEGFSSLKSDPNYLGKVDKSARQKAKAYSLGIPYGLGDFKLSKDLDIPQHEATQLLNQYLDAFPKLKQWMDDTDLKVETLGYVESGVGRMRRMLDAPLIYTEFGPMIYDSLELWKQFHDCPTRYAEVKDLRRRFKNYIGNGRNFQIQSLAASIVNRAGIKIAQELRDKQLDAYLILQAHDEWLLECNDVIIEEVSEIIQRCMEGVMSLSVKLKAVPSVAKNYAEAK